MSEELKACPKCLSNEISIFDIPWENFSTQHVIKCADCSISLSGFNKEKLMAEWNTRPEPRCPCGGVIYANTEDWKVPVCYECFEEIREFFNNTRPEPRCDQCKHYNHSMCESYDQLVMKDFYCKYFEPTGKSG